MTRRLRSVSSLTALLLAITVGASLNAVSAESLVNVAQVEGRGAGMTATANEGRFSVITIPDTQLETYPSTNTLLANRARWIVNNKAALNVKFVLHTGDVVDSDDGVHSQYKLAAPAMRILNSGSVPWLPSVGNHDTAAVCGGPACNPKTTYLTVRDTRTFNRYFPVSGLPWVQGTFEANKVDNAWSTFTAGGQQWLVMNLELWPRAKVVDWADRVVKAHPRHNVLLETHAYLQPNGSIGQRKEYGATSPQYLHDHLIMPNSNIKMVFSGHVGIAAHREEVRADGTKVVAVLGTFHSRKNNPTQIVTFDTAAHTITTRFYAPSNGQTWPQHAATFSGMTWAGSTTTAVAERKIALRSIANNQLVTALSGGRGSLIANRSRIGSLELFGVVNRGHGDIALRSSAGKYVCTARAGGDPLIANRSAIGNWETFQMINNADGTVSFRARSNGKYVTAEKAGKSPLIANRNAIGPWEKFKLINA